MAKAVDKAKSVAYASLGVPLLIVDAIAGRKIGTPDRVNDHANSARDHATKSLTKFRAVSEPHAAKLTGKLPDKVASTISSNCKKAWNRMGIDDPAPTEDPEPTEDPTATDDPKPTE